MSSICSKLPTFVYAPRSGFFALFTVLATGMSRFTSLFLRERHLDDSQVGIALGVSSLSFIATPFFTAFADQYSKDRTTALLTMTFVGLMLVLAQSMVDFNLVGAAAAPVFLTLNRLLISSALAPQSPVLDALAVEGNLHVENYGSERLWGAVSWGVVHLVMGGLIDVAGGTYVIYYMTIAASIFYCSLLLLWRKRQEREEEKKKMAEAAEEGEAEAEAEAEAEEEEKVVEKVVVMVGQKEGDKERAATTATTATTTATTATTAAAESIVHSPSSRQSITLCHLLKSQFQFVFSRPDITFFLIDIFLLSAGTSIVEGLLFLFFVTTLNASNLLLGMTVVMTVLFEIPLFALSDKILTKFSTTQLIVVAHVAYVVRVFGYTFIPDNAPALVLLFEPLHGVTYALKQMVSVTLLAKYAPHGFKNSAQGVVTTAARLGGFTGSIVGGFVLKYQGPTFLYRGAGILVACAGILFVCSDQYYSSEKKNGGRGSRSSVVGAEATASMYQELSEVQGKGDDDNTT